MSWRFGAEGWGLQGSGSRVRGGKGGAQHQWFDRGRTSKVTISRPGATVSRARTRELKLAKVEKKWRKSSTRMSRVLWKTNALGVMKRRSNTPCFTFILNSAWNVVKLQRRRVKGRAMEPWSAS